MRVVLLIARYREDLTWVEDVPDEVVVNEGGDFPRIRRDNLTVFRAKNVGRESETYVNYIVRNYEKLPDQIIFAQDRAIPSNTLRSFRNSSGTSKPTRHRCKV